MDDKELPLVTEVDQIPAEVLEECTDNKGEE